MQKTVTRFAPSPTGYVHVGNIRTGLFAWLVARKNGGKAILRIEDTDQSRFFEGSTEILLETLDWLGLSFDEGYSIGGADGPYLQSERKEIYYKYAKKLIDKGLAYADPYSKEELDEFRDEAIKNKIPFLYRNYRPKNPPIWDGQQPLRLKVVEPKRTNWNDLVMGSLSAGPEAQDDFIIIKSDGLPTYNFAHIIDDFEMGVTHVIRGIEFISSTPKYLSLYEALDIEPPQIASVPHIMRPDGKKKLGKRDGAVSVTEYRDRGVLEEAMINFLASLGWNDGSEKEVYTVDELIKKFDLNKVQKSGARFDENKLIWLNGQWIKRLETSDLMKRSEKYWPKEAKEANSEYREKVLKVSQERMKLLSDLPSLTKFFFTEPEIDLSLIADDKNLSKMESKDLQNLVKKSIEKLETVNFNEIAVQKALNDLLVETESKPAILFSLIRISITWAKFSPGLAESMSILGKEKVINRLTQSLSVL